PGGAAADPSSSGVVRCETHVVVLRRCSKAPPERNRDGRRQRRRRRRDDVDGDNGGDADDFCVLLGGEWLLLPSCTPLDSSAMSGDFNSTPSTYCQMPSSRTQQHQPMMTRPDTVGRCTAGRGRR
ncbi:hypothetical protein LSH36_529g01018, partial [Paralvinella palmiformis]